MTNDMTAHFEALDRDLEWQSKPLGHGLEWSGTGWTKELTKKQREAVSAEMAIWTAEYPGVCPGCGDRDGNPPHTACAYYSAMDIDPDEHTYEECFIGGCGGCD